MDRVISVFVVIVCTSSSEWRQAIPRLGGSSNNNEAFVA